MQGVQTFISLLVVQSILRGECVAKRPRRRLTGKRSISLSGIQILNQTVPCSPVDSEDPNYVNTTNGTRLRRLALDDDHMMEVLRQKGGAFLPSYMATNNPVRAKKDFMEKFRSRDRQRDPSFHPRPFDENDDNYKAKQMLLKYLMKRKFHRTTRSSLRKVVEDIVSNDRLDAERSKRTSTSNNPSINGHTEVGFCQGRGAKTTDGYVHMCTVCTATTTLPPNRFPRSIFEEVCDATDRQCLFTGPTAHGACKQRTLTINLLRKKEGACAIAVVEGQQVLVDEWELYTHQLRVGCECMIDSRSVFAPLLGRSPVRRR